MPSRDELQDKCQEMQARFGIDDMEWEELFGNEDGLFGFVTSLIDEHDTETYNKGIDALAKALKDKGMAYHPVADAESISPMDVVATAKELSTKPQEREQ